MRHFLKALFLAFAGLAWIGCAHAQDYPSKPIRIISPYPPGGNADLVTRAAAVKLGQATGWTVIVENRAGASGLIGLQALHQAAPDGYTIVMSGYPLVSAAMLLKSNIDLQNDVVPAGSLGAVPIVMYVGPSVPFKTARELITFAKANPGVLNASSAGQGTTGHLALELFKARTGADIKHVPFKSGSESIVSLLRGDVQVSFSPVSDALPRLDQGVKILAVTSQERVSLVPTVPTMAEAGVPNLAIELWYGYWMPKGTPPAIVNKFYTALVSATAQPDFQPVAQRLGLTVAPMTPAVMNKRISDDMVQLREMFKLADIKVE